MQKTQVVKFNIISTDIRNDSWNKKVIKFQKKWRRYDKHTFIGIL